eukprot:3646413-Rhodomonas_salina.3
MLKCSFLYLISGSRCTIAVLRQACDFAAVLLAPLLGGPCRVRRREPAVTRSHADGGRAPCRYDLNHDGASQCWHHISRVRQGAAGFSGVTTLCLHNPTQANPLKSQSKVPDQQGVSSLVWTSRQ